MQDSRVRSRLSGMSEVKNILRFQPDEVGRVEQINKPFLSIKLDAGGKVNAVMKAIDHRDKMALVTAMEMLLEDLRNQIRKEQGGVCLHEYH